MRTINWEIETLDNGITLEDKYFLSKEAALGDDGNHEGIVTLLGNRLFAELRAFFNDTESIKAKITINIEEL